MLGMAAVTEFDCVTDCTDASCRTGLSLGVSNVCDVYGTVRLVGRSGVGLTQFSSSGSSNLTRGYGSDTAVGGGGGTREEEMGTKEEEMGTEESSR
jgi:hypothetical protein